MRLETLLKRLEPQRQEMERLRRCHAYLSKFERGKLRLIDYLAAIGIDNDEKLCALKRQEVIRWGAGESIWNKVKKLQEQVK